MLIDFLTEIVRFVHSIRSNLEDLGIVIVALVLTIMALVGAGYAFGLLEWKEKGRTKGKKFLEKSQSSSPTNNKDKSKKALHTTRGVKMSTYNGGPKNSAHHNFMDKPSADILEDLDEYVIL